MATPDQLREMTDTRPFHPFLIKMTSGRSFTVKHPENMAWDNRGRAMAIFDDEGTHLVDIPGRGHRAHELAVQHRRR